jgi:transposase
MGSTRRSFSREFKLEAVRMVSEGGHSLAQVGRDLDIRPHMLRRWRRRAEQDPEQAFPGVEMTSRLVTSEAGRERHRGRSSLSLGEHSLAGLPLARVRSDHPSR